MPWAHESEPWPHEARAGAVSQTTSAQEWHVETAQVPEHSLFHVNNNVNKRPLPWQEDVDPFEVEARCQTT